MSQFIESIRVVDGVIENLMHHQLRVDSTLKAFGAIENSIVLNTILAKIDIPNKGLYKLRISYGLDGNYQIRWLPYQFKTIASFALVAIQEQEYAFKFENRDWINKALMQSGKEEMIMHHQGWIKDSSYANIVFYDGINWVTPEAPLLAGTQRAKLIQEGVIQTGPIHIEAIPAFQSFKLINAMLVWEDTIDYQVSMIM